MAGGEFDQGRVIATVLQDPGPHNGKRYSLVGPKVMNHEEIVAEIGAAIGRAVVYQPISVDDFKMRLERNGIHPFNVQHICSVAVDYQNGVFAESNDWVERITGRPPLTVTQFVANNPSDFGLE